MLIKEKDMLLKNLIKIETGLVKVYNRLSMRDSFTPPVRNFWRSLSLEESIHADIFDEIRQAMINDGIQVSIDIDNEKLKEFVDKVNDYIKKTASEDLSDSDAYSIGAFIEAELDEAAFVKKIETIDKKFTTMLKRIQNDTQKHRVMLVNHSRGIK